MLWNYATCDLSPGYHVEKKVNPAGRNGPKHCNYTLEVQIDYLLNVFSIKTTLLTIRCIRIVFINKSRVDYSALIDYLP